MNFFEITVQLHIRLLEQHQHNFSLDMQSKLGFQFIKVFIKRIQMKKKLDLMIVKIKLKLKIDLTIVIKHKHAILKLVIQYW